jgi:hypothetical protein
MGKLVVFKHYNLQISSFPSSTQCHLINVFSFMPLTPILSLHQPSPEGGVIPRKLCMHRASSDSRKVILLLTQKILLHFNSQIESIRFD